MVSKTWWHRAGCRLEGTLTGAGHVCNARNGEVATMELTSREMMLIKRALAMYGKELFDNIVKDNSATIAQSTLSEVGPLVLKVSRAIRKEEM